MGNECAVEFSTEKRNYADLGSSPEDAVLCPDPERIVPVSGRREAVCSILRWRNLLSCPVHNVERRQRRTRSRWWSDTSSYYQLNRYVKPEDTIFYSVISRRLRALAFGNFRHLCRTRTIIQPRQRTSTLLHTQLPHPLA